MTQRDQLIALLRNHTIEITFNDELDEFVATSSRYPYSGFGKDPKSALNRLLARIVKSEAGSE